MCAKLIVSDLCFLTAENSQAVLSESYQIKKLPKLGKDGQKPA